MRLGLQNLRMLDDWEVMALTAPTFEPRELLALAGQDAWSLDAVETMCVLLRHLRAHLPRSGFRAAFEDKGRFADFLSRIPTWLIEAEQPALRGAAMGLGVRVAV